VWKDGKMAVWRDILKARMWVECWVLHLAVWMAKMREEHWVDKKACLLVKSVVAL
jgi:hypothetical protein